MDFVSIRSVAIACLLLLPAASTFGQWSRTNGPEGGYTSLLFHDPTSGYIFAGGNGFYRSRDNGATWSESNTGMDATASPVAMVRSGANLFTASLDKVYLSTDNGTTWTVRGSGLPQILSMGVIGSTLVVGTNVYGVYRSTNDGVTWSPASGFQGMNDIVQTITTNGTRLLAGLGGKGVWISTDNGAN